ncbi:MAG: hypothetical protein ACFCUM_00345 [Bacteroidales bacterium]
MLKRILKYNTTAGYLVILLVTIVSWWPSLHSDNVQQMAFDYIPMPLYEMLTGFISQYVLASRLAAIGLILLAGFYLLSLNEKYSILRERALFPAFFFILIVSSYDDLHRLHPALIALLFFLPALDKILASYKTEGLSTNYFEATFLLGAGSLFYFNLIYFILIVWIALLVLRPVIWREWVLSIMGILTPWFFFLVYDYLTTESIDRTVDLFVVNITTGYELMLVFIPHMIFMGILLFLIILASRKVIISMAKMRVLTRKIYVLFFWIFLVGLSAWFILETANIELIVLVAVPVSFLLSNYMLSINSAFWSNFILWSLIVAVQAIVWLPLIIA